MSNIIYLKNNQNDKIKLGSYLHFLRNGSEYPNVIGLSMLSNQSYFLQQSNGFQYIPNKIKTYNMKKYIDNIYEFPTNKELLSENKLTKKNIKNFILIMLIGMSIITFGTILFKYNSF